MLLPGLLLLCGVADFTGSLTITTPEQAVQKAKWETAHLPCMFSLSPEDQGPLDVEWLKISGSDNEKLDHVIILYSGDKIYSDFYQDLKGRVHFTNDDNIKCGDASVTITDLQLWDAGTYLCKVKKAPGFARRNLKLTVFNFTGSLTITTPEQTIQKATGETAHLPCMFSLSPEDQGPLDIKWLKISGPDNEQLEHVIILYSGDKIYYDYYEDLKGRVHFTNDDNIKSGDASINITDVQLSDTGSYLRKVKKAPGAARRSLQLTVTDFTGSLNITTLEQTVQKAKGQTAYQPCTFSLKPPNKGPMYIEWLQIAGPENEEVNRMIIIYVMDKVYSDFYEDLKGRVHFISDNIKSGDASINIIDVQLPDAGTYQCGVFGLYSVACRNLRLTVTD